MTLEYCEIRKWTDKLIFLTDVVHGVAVVSYMGTLSSQDGNPKEPIIPSHTAPHLNFSITYKRSVEFQMEIKIICRRGFGSQTTQIVVISRCCFA